MEEGEIEKEAEGEVTPEEAEIKPETDVKPVKETGSGLRGRMKNWVIIILFIVILTSIGTLFLWKGGIDNLQGDELYLIVVQEKGVAKAGSIYELATDEADIINVEELPAVTDLGRFYRDASQGQRIDRLIVVRVDTITELSTEPYLEYRGEKIPSEDVGGYITGALWDADLAGDDPPWKFRANLLSEWLELHSDKIWSGDYSSKVINKLFMDYRSGNIKIYPRNTALIILKYIPLEQIFL